MYPRFVRVASHIGATRGAPLPLHSESTAGSPGGTTGFRVALDADNVIEARCGAASGSPAGGLASAASCAAAADAAILASLRRKVSALYGVRTTFKLVDADGFEVVEARSLGDGDVLTMVPSGRASSAACGSVAEVASMYDFEAYPPRPLSHEKPNQLQSMAACSPLRMSQVLWGGARNYTHPEPQDATFKALIAGGGSGDATVAMAFLLQRAGVPAAEVVHMDVSAGAIELARARMAVHAAETPNVKVTFIHAPLTDAPDLGIGPFDFINCVGVLHHTPSPVEGLRALASVLKPNGGIEFLVYGRVGRTGIYEFRDVLRRLEPLLLDDGARDMSADRSPQVDVDADGSATTVGTFASGSERRLAMVGLAHAAYRGLPKHNLLARSAVLANSWEVIELEGAKRIAQGDDPRAPGMVAGAGNSGVSDMFLHACDVPYSFDEVVELARAAGMRVVESKNRRDYAVPLEQFARDVDAAIASMHDRDIAPVEAHAAMSALERALSGLGGAGNGVAVDDSRPGRWVQDAIHRLPLAEYAALGELVGAKAITHHVWLAFDGHPTAVEMSDVDHGARVGPGSAVCMHQEYNSHDIAGHVEPGWQSDPALQQMLEKGRRDPDGRFNLTVGVAIGNSMPPLTAAILMLQRCDRSVADMHAELMRRWPPDYDLPLEAFVEQVREFVVASQGADMFTVLRRPLFKEHADALAWHVEGGEFVYDGPMPGVPPTSS